MRSTAREDKSQMTLTPTVGVAENALRQLAGEARLMLSRRWKTGLLALLAAGALAAAGDSDLEPAAEQDWVLPGADLFAIELGDQRAWAAGYWGVLLLSEDGGRSWRVAPTPTSESIFSVSFGDDRHGFAVGANGLVLRSTDGGESWSRQTVLLEDEFGDSWPLGTSLFGVQAVGGNEAWAVGDFGVVLHTTNGATWEQIRFDEATFGDDNLTDRILNAVEFSDRQNGWIAGEFGTVVRTTDGGRSWVGSREFEDTPEDLYVFALSSSEVGRAFAVGLAGSVLLTIDGGQHWQPRNVPTNAGLYAVAWRGDRGVVVGDRGVIFLTENSGQSWREAERPRLFSWLTGVAFGGDGSALAVGEGGLILRSADQGRSWNRVTWRSPQAAPLLPAQGGENGASAGEGP